MPRHPARYDLDGEPVASLDQVSGGRFIFGIGGGWNAEEMEDRGTIYETRFKKLREQIEAMKEMWTKATPEYYGELVDFPSMVTWPKPVQKPHPPIIVGGAFPYAAGFAAATASSASLKRRIRRGGGISPAVSADGARIRPRSKVVIGDPGGAPEDPDRLKRYRDLGVARMNVRLPPGKADEILPVLDHWAKLIPHLH